MDAAEFVATAARCTRCALSATRQRVVVGAGPWHAAIALVGEAPGRHEDESGEPFVGRSGQLLFALLRDEAGLAREDCYVTSVVKCRPPNNRTPTRGELAACRPWWLQQRELFDVRVIVTLGNTATKAVLEVNEPISALRGRVYTPTSGPPVVPTFHPAAAVRNGKRVAELMRADFALVATLLAAS